MKTFAVGFLLGAIVCFIVMRVVAPRSPVEPAAVNEQVAVRSSSSQTPQLAAPSCPEIKNVETQRIETSAPASASAVVTNVVRRVSIDDYTDQEAQQICTQMYQRQAQRERDKKDAEPVDAAWAPAMEMLIRQHVESSLARKQYSQMTLQCRTTFCELKIEGAGGEENLKLAQAFVQEIANEPWAESLVNKGISGTGRGGDTWEVRQEWFRPRTETELRLWGRKPPQN